jgi:Na+/H+ antiporter NhaC
MELFGQNPILVLIVLMLWVLPWKGYALWTAARAGHKRWFIILIVLNTFAILDIIYIFYVAKRKPMDFLRAFKTKL